jgi:hypothetical protein
MRTVVVVTVVTAILFGDALTRVAAQVVTPATRANEPATLGAQQYARARMQDDVAALRTYRPQFPFWRYIFTIRDGAIIFGSAVDGRLIATLPAEGDWRREGIWVDPSLASLLEDHPLPDDLSDRRDELARLLEPAIGPVVHNATRGRFLLPNERPYGAFLDEWGAIYERFGVPAELGLAQAIVESGLDGNARSESRAIGFCQWLRSNWKPPEATPRLR